MLAYRPLAADHFSAVSPANVEALIMGPVFRFASPGSFLLHMLSLSKCPPASKVSKPNARSPPSRSTPSLIPASRLVVSCALRDWPNIIVTTTDHPPPQLHPSRETSTARPTPYGGRYTTRPPPFLSPGSLLCCYRKGSFVAALFRSRLREHLHVYHLGLPPALTIYTVDPPTLIGRTRTTEIYSQAKQRDQPVTSRQWYIHTAR